MGEHEMTELIMAVVVLLAIFGVLYFLRGKLKKGEFKGFGVSGTVTTQDPDNVTVKNTEQESKDGSNKATIHSDRVTVDGLKQTAKKDNTLEIGKP